MVNLRELALDVIKFNQLKTKIENAKIALKNDSKISHREYLSITFKKSYTYIYTQKDQEVIDKLNKEIDKLKAQRDSIKPIDKIVNNERHAIELIPSELAIKEYNKINTINIAASKTAKVK